MTRIGLLSDTHGYLDPKIPEYFKNCNEIWHAGDIGDIRVTDALATLKPVRAVYGNIDGGVIRKAFTEDLLFQCEDVKVFITHIGGYPGKYNPRVRAKIEAQSPKLFICGHSHILKVMFDKKYNLLHINPGAAGKYGMHQVKTIIRFAIDGKEIKDLEVIELGKRV